MKDWNSNTWRYASWMEDSGPDDPAHPGVLPVDADPAGATGPVLASSVGAVAPEAGTVGAEGIPIGLTEAPDASDRGGT